MKHALSLIACGIICIVLLQYRVANIQPDAPLKITYWDANGYYLYLPSLLIYHDFRQLCWIDTIDKKYSVTGGDGVQAQKADNGNYVFKYLGGVAIMELPFFCIGHWIALHSHYPPDGFSPPYQYALGFGIIFYSLLAVLLLRKILLHYFSDLTAAITLLLICLATNYVQYAAVDSGQSHAYIFVLYVVVLYTALKWHQSPRVLWACLTGYICGLAAMSRPTEAIIVLIPLLWDTHSREAAKAKWALVKQHKSHIIFAAICGLLGVLPQLIYWKTATGSFIYDVGSKWKFLNPYFRVLFGFEKGWFIYTPVTLFFIAGMFFIKPFPFRKSVLWFCLLNIYIIIAWDDWRYGGSYSTRALVQSYPVFALPLAALVERIGKTKWKPAFYVVCAYLTGVNLFQTTQYCKTILHFNDMNRLYYGRIYLNPNPTPLDMSFLDNDEWLSNEKGYVSETVIKADTPLAIHANPGLPYLIAEHPLASKENTSGKQWLKINALLRSEELWQAYLSAEISSVSGKKTAKVRLFNAISKSGKDNTYTFWMSVPDTLKSSTVQLFISSPFHFNGTLQKLSVTEYHRTGK